MLGVRVVKPGELEAELKARRIVLDCVHLGEECRRPENAKPGSVYRECEKGHGPQCACDRPQKCGSMCPDHEKA